MTSGGDFSGGAQQLCPACGAPLVPGAGFCAACGAPAPVAASPLGPRRLSDIFSGTFQVYGRNLLKLAAIVAVVHLSMMLMAIIFVALALGLGMSNTGFAPGQAPGELLPEASAIAGLVIAALLFVMVAVLAYVLMEGALVHGIAAQFIRIPISLTLAYSVAWRRILAMLGASILSGLAVALMIISIIGIPFAVYFAVRWQFVVHAALLEGLGPRNSLSRSSQLVHGNWWRALGIILVMMLTALVISLVASLLLGLIPIVGSIAAVILTGPLFSIPGTLLYLDLRVRNGESGQSILDDLEVRLWLEPAPESPQF